MNASLDSNTQVIEVLAHSFNEASFQTNTVVAGIQTRTVWTRAEHETRQIVVPWPSNFLSLRD